MQYTATDQLSIDPITRELHVQLTVDDPDLISIYEDLEEVDRTEFAEKAFKIGSIALRDAETVGKTDYVDKAFERLQTRMEDSLDRLFGEDGKLENAVEEAVGEDGHMAKVLEDVFGEEGKLHRELEAEFGEDGGRLFRLLNPSDERTPLGLFRKKLEERFDPDKKGSFLYELKDQLRTGFEEIQRGLGILEAVEEEAEKGTQKGLKFEGFVGELLEEAADPFGDEIVPTGTDEGAAGCKVGDFACHLNPENVGGVTRTLVVEVKDKYVPLKGKNSLHKELDQALENRVADFAIAVVKSEHTASWGPLHYVAPNHIYVGVDSEASDHLALDVAYRLGRTLCSARAAKEGVHIDAETVADYLDRIQRRFEIVRTMKRNLTSATNKIGDVKGLLDSLRDEVIELVDELREHVGCEEEEEE